MYSHIATESPADMISHPFGPNFDEDGAPMGYTQMSFALLDEITAHREARANGTRRPKLNTPRAHRSTILSGIAALFAAFFTA